MELGHDVAQSEDDFMVCAGNELAFAHVMAFPSWASPATVLVGAAKSGKSHLARIWAQRAGAVAATTKTAEELATHGGKQPVLVDDVDRDGYLESDLFHLLNQSMRDERPILLTARVPIAEWPYITNDVKSRARLAALFSLTAPDDILLSQMFVKLFTDRQLSVDPKVISYLVSRMERSSEEVVALVELLDRMSLSRGRAITRAIAAEALEIRSER
ncbi:HdaA/DnaA family protein [Pelagibacterium sp.]|uniref:HdaA/DnaA family protein n=1 Tax=Pelagibacterium sp. TaxID=1967288 RepID=UPI003A91DD36